MAVRANRLTEVKIRKISLVDRGAARAPFKIQKRESGTEIGLETVKGAAMSLLDKVFKRQPAQVAPAVVAVMVNKASDLDAVLERMKGAGLELKEKTEIDGGVILHDTGFEQAEDDLVMKFDDNFAAVVRGVKKGLLFPEPSSVPSWTFADDFTSNGILPGIDAALSAMGCAVWSAVYSADTPADAAGKVSALFDEGKAYVNAIIGAIPSTAYKMDKVVSKGSIPLTGTADGVTGETGKFPMEGSGRQGKPIAMGADGGSQGVDTTSGSDIDGDNDAALSAIGGVHKAEPAKKKGDGDTTGSSADGKGADADANAGGSNIPAAKQKTIAKVEEVSAARATNAAAQTLAERQKGDRTAATANDMPAVRQKAADAPGGDSGFQKGTGSRPSKNGEPIDSAVDIEAAPRGGGQDPGVNSVLKDEDAVQEEAFKKAMEPFTNALKALMDGQNTLTVTLKGFEGNLLDMSTRVAKSEDVSKRIAATLRGTIQATDVEGEEAVSVQKNEYMNGANSASAGLIDTAYDRTLQRGD